MDVGEASSFSTKTDRRMDRRRLFRARFPVYPATVRSSFFFFFANTVRSSFDADPKHDSRGRWWPDAPLRAVRTTASAVLSRSSSWVATLLARSVLR